MGFTFPYPGPIPPYTNLPINAQYYAPNQFFINAISLGPTTIVTTTQENNYVVGQLVRLLIPKQNGTRQLNEQSGYVISLPSSTQVEININSQFYDTFITTSLPNQPQILAIGNINSGAINSNGGQMTGTYIPGSFIDISPL